MRRIASVSGVYWGLCSGVLGAGYIDADGQSMLESLDVKQRRVRCFADVAASASEQEQQQAACATVQGRLQCTHSEMHAPFASPLAPLPPQDPALIDLPVTPPQN